MSSLVLVLSIFVGNEPIGHCGAVDHLIVEFPSNHFENIPTKVPILTAMTVWLGWTPPSKVKKLQKQDNPVQLYNARR